jgi:hypothetical protein
MLPARSTGLRYAVGLYRVSTAEQGHSGLGLEAQQASVRAFTAAQDWMLGSICPSKPTMPICEGDARAQQKRHCVVQAVISSTAEADLGRHISPDANSGCTMPRARSDEELPTWPVSIVPLSVRTSLAAPHRLIRRSLRRKLGRSSSSA